MKKEKFIDFLNNNFKVRAYNHYIKDPEIYSALNGSSYITTVLVDEKVLCFIFESGEIFGTELDYRIVHDIIRDDKKSHLDKYNRALTGLKYFVAHEKNTKLSDAISRFYSALNDTSGIRIFSENDEIVHAEYNNIVNIVSKEEKTRVLFKDIALRVAEESHCSRLKVAALAVKNGRIIGTGINGSLKGAENCDTYFKKIFIESNFKNTETFEDWTAKPDFKKRHHEWANTNEMHAEMNLLCESAKNGVSLEGCDIYVTSQPCSECSKMLSIVKPKRIFYIKDYEYTDYNVVLNNIVSSNIIY